MAAAATPFRAKKQRALHAVQAAVKGLSPEEVVDVLTQQLKTVARRAVKRTAAPEPKLAVLRDRPAGRPSSIELDPELELFILAQSSSQTIEHIRQLCIKEFGEERAPKRSTLHRYIQKLKYRSKGGK